MTMEMAAFYRRMLSVGLSDVYQRDIGLALEKENPLSNILLDLAYCLSDINKTISILDNYIGDCILDEQKIYPMILAEMRLQYDNGCLKLEQVTEALFGILESEQLWNEEPWEELMYLYYEYDEVKAGWLYLDDFLESFAEYFLDKNERRDINV